MSARSEPGRSDCDGAQIARAASSTRNSGFPPLRSTRSSTRDSSGAAPSPSRSRSRRTSVAASVDESGASGTRKQQRTVEQRWWPEQIVVRALTRDEQERKVGQRAHDDGEQVAHHRIGPLQVVDPEHRHAGLSVATHRLGDHPGNAVPHAGRIELIELRGVPEEIGDHAQQAFDQLVAGDARPELLGAHFDSHAYVVRRRIRFEGEQRRQSVAKRRPQARFAIGRTRRLEDDRLVGETRDDVIGEAGLAAARLADDRHHPAVSGAHERDRRLEQGEFVEPPDERDVAAHRPRTGCGRPGDDPRLLGLLAAADLGDPEGFAANSGGAQRLRRLADQHAARWRQRLAVVRRC